MPPGRLEPAYRALAEADVWAPVSTASLPAELVRAVDRANWDVARAQLQQVMDGLTTDGVYGRALLQLVRRLPIGVDPVFDRYRAAVAIDFGDWDDLRKCLAGSPVEARELDMPRETLLRSVNVVHGRPTVPLDRAPYLAYEFALSGRVGWYRQWAKRLAASDVESRFSRPDVPAGRHLRYRMLHHTVLLAIGEAHAGRLLAATALAEKGRTLGDVGEPLRDIASDLAELIPVAMGEPAPRTPLRVADRTPTSAGTSPLGTLEWLIHLMPFIALLPDGWLGAAASQMQRIAVRIGSPKAQLLAGSWIVAGDRQSEHRSSKRDELPALIAGSKGADAGLRVLPQLLLACDAQRYKAFQQAERLARSVGSVWAQIAALTWMVSLDPSPATCRNLFRLVELTGWRRVVLTPDPVVSDAVLALMSFGYRGKSLIELALAAGRSTVATEIAERHASDLALPLNTRTRAVEALTQVGTVHSRQILAKIGRMGGPEALTRQVRDGSRAAALSAREVEVIDLAGQGLTNRQIAGQLGISQHTVARHLANARDKLGAANRTDAAVRLGKLHRGLK